jgi:phosphatidylglycerol---prolipoprotein diacylglyceryl transferase
MWPILFSVGNFHLYSLSVFIILSWIVFSFIFWRQMRQYGIEEDKIFNLTFYGTLITGICSRLTYVLLHWHLFNDNFLKIIVIWVLPGLSVFGAIIGLVLSLIILIKKYKIRLGYLLDSLAVALPYTLVFGLLGGFLDGSRVGKNTNVAWAIHYIGIAGKRHPVQLYEIISLVLIIIFIKYLLRQSNQHKWAYGFVGVWFFFLLGLTQFSLEFLKDNSIYWLSLSFNQWISIAIFSESVGVLYIKGGGKIFIKKLVSKSYINARNTLKGVHNAISKRITRRDPSSP